MLRTILDPLEQSSLAPAFGTWGKPPDHVAWVALGVAVLLTVVAILPRGPRAAASLFDFASIDDLAQRRRFLILGGFVAAFLSLGYIAYYLRGGPRFVDATSYFLQGRALSHGDLSWKIPDPSASFRGRFLLFDAATGKASGIFPPGYPLLLAAGFLFGAPMVVGPLLAAAIAIATYALAKELFVGELGPRVTTASQVRVEGVGRVALVLSLVCAALRYHTAETMAHGASALAITAALVFALRARRTGITSYFAAAGVAAGFAFATQPVSALPVIAVVLVLAFGAQRSARASSVASAVAGALPGFALLLLAGGASGGAGFHVPQIDYYAISDGPPNCFRYGFGAGIGCVNEHAAYVAKYLPNGFGPVEALLTTARRLRFHAEDIANLEPLAFLALVPFVKRTPQNRAPLFALLVVVGIVLVYAPVYFDGNYAGGGARFFADALPVEHALVAFSVARLFPAISLARKAIVVVALACAGFAVHGAHAHEQLANRDGGRPVYEPDVTREVGVKQGLLFVETDEVFNLAHTPGETQSHGLVAARLRNDDHDRLVYDRGGHEPVHRYVTEPGQPPTTPQWIPPPPATNGTNETWRFEAESDWPPLSQARGWAAPFAAESGSCASNGHALELVPAGGAGTIASASIALPVPRDGRWRITPRVLRRGGRGRGTLVLEASGQELATWSWSDDLGLAAAGAPGAEDRVDGACVDLAPRDVELDAARAPQLVIRAEGGTVTIDRTNLSGAIVAAGGSAR